MTQRIRIEVDGRETIDPASFQFVEKLDYPSWRWLIAPVEVLGSDSRLTIVVLILVLFLAMHLLSRTKRVHCARSLVRLSGATLGIFEEVILPVTVTNGLH